uniref:C2H2-type domain-containing protein n=1 Tax=Plectus sambesii TaxID=2011161 RepID=A0A914VWZ7_9BILA
MEMRRHQLRSVLSSTTRKNIVEKLGTEGNADALLTLDWAMKWLPTKARETQKDFFGKKGISWHIAHVLRRSLDDNFEQRTLVHITEQSSQDSETVLAILRHVLKDLKKSGVNSVILRSDNAGCYHGNKVMATINKISEETNVQIMRYTFSESQAGKSSCDRMASVIKRHLHAYIDQGNDVTQGLDFIKAMESAVKVNAMKFFVFKLRRTKNDYPSGKPLIPSVSLLNDVTFHGRGIQAKKHSGIGNGKEIDEQHWKGKESNAKLRILKEDSHPNQTERVEWSPLQCTRHIVPKRVSNDQPNDEEQYCEGEELNERQQTRNENDPSSASEIIDDDDDEDTLKNEEKHDYYDCPEPNCVERFATLGYLQPHIIIGKHKFAIERKTMRDFALHSFQVNIAGNNENRIRLQEPVEEIVNDLELIKDPAYEALLQGWALKRPRKRSPFSGKQKDYINAAFDRGTRKKSEKVDSRQLAKQMEEELVPGTSTFRFRPNELMSASQISGHFTRKLERKRNLPPECSDNPETAVCSDIDDQDETSEDDEYENTEDPMFYSVEDEMTELVAAANIIDDTGEDSDQPSLITTAPATAVKLHNLRRKTKKPS